MITKKRSRWFWERTDSFVFTNKYHRSNVVYLQCKAPFLTKVLSLAQFSSSVSSTPYIFNERTCFGKNINVTVGEEFREWSFWQNFVEIFHNSFFLCYFTFFSVKFFLSSFDWAYSHFDCFSKLSRVYEVVDQFHSSMTFSVEWAALEITCLYITDISCHIAMTYM